MQVKCHCQNCGQKLGFDSEYIGQTVNCPHCKCDTQLYSPSTEHKPEGMAQKELAGTPKRLKGKLIVAAAVILIACIVLASIVIYATRKALPSSTAEKAQVAQASTLDFTNGTETNSQSTMNSNADNTNHSDNPLFDPIYGLPVNDDSASAATIYLGENQTLAEAKYLNFAIIGWTDYFLKFPSGQPPIQYQPLYSKSLYNIIVSLPPSVASSVACGQYRNFPLRGPRFNDVFCMDNEWKIDRAGYPVTVSQFGTALYNRVTVFSVDKREIMGYRVDCASIIRIRIANSLYFHSHDSRYFDVDPNNRDHKEYLRAPWDECLEICSDVSPIGKSISDELDKGMAKLVASPNESVKVCKYINMLTVIYILSAREDADGTIVINYTVNILAHNLGEAYRPELNAVFW